MKKKILLSNSSNKICNFCYNQILRQIIQVVCIISSKALKQSEFRFFFTVVRKTSNNVFKIMWFALKYIFFPEAGRCRSADSVGPGTVHR